VSEVPSVTNREGALSSKSQMVRRILGCISEFVGGAEDFAVWPNRTAVDNLPLTCMWPTVIPSN
jgi:hypothetical protein